MFFPQTFYRNIYGIYGKRQFFAGEKFQKKIVWAKQICGQKKCLQKNDGQKNVSKKNVGQNFLGEQKL